MNFQNKNILIVGASSGMGKEIAIELDNSGASVILVARDEDKLQILKKQLSDRALCYSCDVSNIESIKAIFNFCKEKSKRLDGLVYTVGICDMIPVRSMIADRALYSMNVNCVAFMELVKFFSSKRCSNDGSSIVAMSSYESTLCDKGQSLYAATKAGLEAYVRVASKELATRKIRVNAILPAIVDTPMLHRSQEQGNYNYETIEQIQAFGVIDPVQVAYLSTFLLSDHARFITGECIKMSAGWIGEK